MIVYEVKEDADFSELSESRKLVTGHLNQYRPYVNSHQHVILPTGEYNCLLISDVLIYGRIHNSINLIL